MPRPHSLGREVECQGVQTLLQLEQGSDLIALQEEYEPCKTRIDWQRYS